jgi:hypothetical protein
VAGPVEVPLASVNEEATRVAAAIAKDGIPLRLIGGGAIYLRCPTAREGTLHRAYADLDFVGLEEHGPRIRRFFESLGYEPDTWFNKLHGRTRMLFWDQANGRQADVFLDRMTMCHVLEFRNRLEIDSQTLTLADLLLTKLQIVEMNRKDLVDLVALLVDHSIGDQDGEQINGAFIAHLTANDWGLHRTVTQNLQQVRQAAAEFRDVGGLPLETQLDVLQALIDQASKSPAWRVRALVGERVRWYETPEEVRRT